MTTEQEMNLGIEAWIVGIVALALLVVATLAPQCDVRDFAGAQDAKHFRSHLVTSALPSHPRIEGVAYRGSAQPA